MLTVRIAGEGNCLLTIGGDTRKVKLVDITKPVEISFDTKNYLAATFDEILTEEEVKKQLDKKSKYLVKEVNEIEKSIEELLKNDEEAKDVFEKTVLNWKKFKEKYLKSIRPFDQIKKETTKSYVLSKLFAIRIALLKMQKVYILNSASSECKPWWMNQKHINIWELNFRPPRDPRKIHKMFYPSEMQNRKVSNEIKNYAKLALEKHASDPSFKIQYHEMNSAWGTFCRSVIDQIIGPKDWESKYDILARYVADPYRISLKWKRAAILKLYRPFYKGKFPVNRRRYR